MLTGFDARRAQRFVTDGLRFQSAAVSSLFCSSRKAAIAFRHSASCSAGTDVLLLAAVEELRYEEISAMLAIPIGTVMSRISRARDKLRRMTSGYSQQLIAVAGELAQQHRRAPPE